METPPIGLPNLPTMLTYKHYVDTQSFSDGYNIKISTDGGSTFSVLQTVDPSYPDFTTGESVYGGSVAVWEDVSADLAAYAGQQIVLRFSFRSDDSFVAPGVYIDDIKVIATDSVPVVITTPTLRNAYENASFSQQLTSTGGTGMGDWSIQAGSNIAWLSLSAAGAFSGMPATADVGPASVTVRIAEPTNPSNFAETTYNFTVLSTLYTDDLEAACPAGWTLTGEWQCGAPTSGPNAAFSGTQVIGTVLNGQYSNNLTWASNTATSAPISLASATAPELNFKVWNDTEGSTYDGFNLNISTDNGATFVPVTTVTPAYPLTIGGQQCWGGLESAAGWQEYVADLSAYAGMSVNLQFAMQSDTSATYDGVYIDDVTIAD